MHKPRLFATFLAVTLSSVAAQQPTQQNEGQPSPAELRVAAAQHQLTAGPKRSQTYNDLALALLRRSRETSNPAFLSDAERALHAGLALTPTDFQLAKTGVALMLARGQFTAARDRAKLLHAQTPDDVTLYGYLAEADLALGDYDEADSSAQWMLNMRPGNTPGLLLGATLRVLYGDAPGALEFLNQAFGETPSIEPEEQAYIANQIAAVELDTGHIDAAAQALARAEQLFPHYPVTTENLVRLRLAQHRPAEAVALLEQQLAAEQAMGSPQSATLFLLAIAQQDSAPTNAAEGERNFVRFAELARGTQADAMSKANLILYDAGLPGRLGANASEALQLAEQRMRQQHDVDTLDAYAWALEANGHYPEAKAAEKKALALGVRSARFFEHAGEIELKLKENAAAAEHFTAAIESDPASPYSAQARLQIGIGAPVLATVPIPPMPAAQASAPASAALTAQPVPALQLVHDTGALPQALLIPRPTGTERAIHRMQALVSAHPGEAGGYAGLGAAFFQRARETGDVEDYQLAEQALTHSLDLVSTDLSATAPLESMAEVCMGEHRFREALDYAQRALALGSGDISAFAIVGDAYADMGEYEKAGTAYSRLSGDSNSGIVGNLHAGQDAGASASAMPNPPADPREAYAQHTRTAYLQFIAGDTTAAIKGMETSIGEGVESHLPSENLAWLYYELGEFRLQAGEVQPAADAYLTALTIHPGDYRALAGLGKVRAQQGEYRQAVTLYQSAIAIVPMPMYVAELGDLLAKNGDVTGAEKQYKLVEYIGLLGHINQVLHNRDLALFYADHDRNLGEALALAHKEFEVRSDIYTWDALAWALYKNGKLAEADEAMSHALRLGTRDPMLLFHAGMISAKLGHESQASQQLSGALAINPHFHTLYADVATQQLSTLHKQSTLAAAALGRGEPHAQ